MPNLHFQLLPDLRYEKTTRHAVQVQNAQLAATSFNRLPHSMNILILRLSGPQSRLSAPMPAMPRSRACLAMSRALIQNHGKVHGIWSQQVRFSRLEQRPMVLMRHHLPSYHRRSSHFTQEEQVKNQENDFEWLWGVFLYFGGIGSYVWVASVPQEEKLVMESVARMLQPVQRGEVAAEDSFGLAEEAIVAVRATVDALLCLKPKLSQESSRDDVFSWYDSCQLCASQDLADETRRIACESVMLARESRIMADVLFKIVSDVKDETMREKLGRTYSMKKCVEKAVRIEKAAARGEEKAKPSIKMSKELWQSLTATSVPRQRQVKENPMSWREPGSSTDRMSDRASDNSAGPSAPLKQLASPTALTQRLELRPAISEATSYSTPKNPFSMNSSTTDHSRKTTSKVNGMLLEASRMVWKES